jgi:hypothetical protein
VRFDPVEPSLLVTSVNPDGVFGVLAVDIVQKTRARSSASVAGQVGVSVSVLPPSVSAPTKVMATPRP